jgi:hypothetical protein
MKYVFILFIGLVLFLSYPLPVSAHLPGQEPYFTLNGKYSDLYPIQSMFPGIELPQDIALEQFLVDDEIDFEIDREKLKQMVPENIIEVTTFTWKFGDGTTGVGLQNKHVYQKMGTYVLEIYAEYEENGHKIQPTLIQSVLFHVLPDRRYQLPKPVIKINGEEENKDPSKNVFELNLENEINFDALSSRAPSSKIVSYLWSFTDGKTSKNPVTNHKFSESTDFVSPALRIKDNNGFFVDAYVGIKNNPDKVQTIAEKIEKKQYIVYTLYFLGFLFIVGFVIWFVNKIRKV